MEKVAVRKIVKIEKKAILYAKETISLHNSHFTFQWGVELFTSVLSGETGHLIYKDNVQICPTAFHSLMLPKFQLLSTNDESLGICLKKGFFVLDNMGDFDFEVLSPKIPEIAEYQYSNIDVKIKETVLFNFTLYSKWENLITINSEYNNF